MRNPALASLLCLTLSLTAFIGGFILGRYAAPPQVVRVHVAPALPSTQPTGLQLSCSRKAWAEYREACKRRAISATIRKEEQ